MPVHRSMVVAAGLLLIACQPDSSDRQMPEASADPESVVREYQALIDRNQFEAAKALSTDKEDLRLSDMASIIAEQETDSTILNTTFVQIKCAARGDSATCLCLLRDQYEAYDAEYHLIRQDGRWLVDAPEEDFQIDEELMPDWLEKSQD